MSQDSVDGQPEDVPVVSVIIPTLNEVHALPATLDALKKAAGGVKHEIIIADGGSTDGTQVLAMASGCACIQPARGQRAAQMNAGVVVARGGILLFLHADTSLPAGALVRIKMTCERVGVVGGGFSRIYDSPSRWLRFTCGLAGWRSRWFGWFLGDQAIFVRRNVFVQLGGYRDFDVFEDVDFSRRLARQGKLAFLQPPVVSSARRFKKQGVLGRSLLDAWLMGRYLLGASPHALLRAHVRPRVSER